MSRRSADLRAAHCLGKLVAMLPGCPALAPCLSVSFTDSTMKAEKQFVCFECMGQ